MTAASFTFRSSDGTEIFATKWSPADLQKPRAAVQIAHGYAEHIGRYAAFAGKLAEAGIVVYGNDHRGHGKTNGNVGEAICFADEAGFDKVVADMRALTEIIQADHPGLPLFLFGHSMGSLLTRRYIQLYGDDLAGAVLSGSGVFSNGLLKLGTVVAASESKGRAVPIRVGCWINWSSRTSTVVSSPPERIWIGSAVTPWKWTSSWRIRCAEKSARLVIFMISSAACWP